VALAIPSALLGFAAFRDDFGSRLRTPGPWEQWVGEYPPYPDPPPVVVTPHLVDFGVELVWPLVVLLLGAGLAWLIWRGRPADDPARALGRLAPVFGSGFYLDAVQDAVVVRPARALARAVRRGDESVVDGAVEGTGRGAVSLGGALALLHRAGLPRAATAMLAGALLIGLAAVVLGGTP
jgi:NADH-quinone oxidoreductase subunit L